MKSVKVCSLTSSLPILRRAVYAIAHVRGGGEMGRAWYEDGKNVTKDHINALANWDPEAEPDTEIQFTSTKYMAALEAEERLSSTSFWR